MAPAASAARAQHPATPARATLADRALSTAQSVRPRLIVVTRAQPRHSALPFTVLCTLIIAVTLLTVLFLNISMSDTSYQISRLQSQSRTLEDTRQGLQEQDAKLGTPQELQARAEALGMVPSGETAYIDLSSGTVIGDPQPAGAPAAGPAPVAPVPQASIYPSDEAYHGMGNEGH